LKSKKQVAIVTGGGRRLGRAIAIALAQHGFEVIVNYNESQQGAYSVIRKIESIGRKAIAIKADISKKNDVTRMIRSTVKVFGRIDLLVNNAAVFLESSLEKISEKLWDTTIDINLKGTFLCSQAVAPIMFKQKQGKIINIASLGGVQSWSQHLPYSVSKAGVIMLTRCLAKSLAPNVFVNAIAPGTIIFDDEENPKIKHIPKEQILLQRYGKPFDITDLVIFLATTAQYITAQVFIVDGGRAA
jgi:3-oxoacyl-[acyl-carrier protein] reductase